MVQFIYQEPKGGVKVEPEPELELGGGKPAKAHIVKRYAKLTKIIEPEPDDPNVDQAEFDWLTGRKMGT